MRGSSALRSVTNLRLYRMVEVVLPMTVLTILTSVASIFMGRQIAGCWLVFSLLVLLRVGLRPVGPRGEVASASNSIWNRPLEDFRWGPYLWIPFVVLMIVASAIITVNAWIYTFGISAGPTAVACLIIGTSVFRPRQRPPYQAPPDNREGAGCPVRPITRRPLAGSNRARIPR